jgi:hypothetical protein
VGSEQLDPNLLPQYGDIATNAKFEEVDKRSNSQWINVLYPPPPFIAAYGTGEVADTSIIQAMMDTGRKLYWPTPSVHYLIDDTLYPKLNGLEWEGEFWLDTKIKFTGVNKEFLYGVSPTPIGGVTYSPNYGTINNMFIEGLGAGSLQTAFNMVGYITTFKKLVVTGFKTVGVVAGVYVYVKDCYIYNNNDGIIIGPNTSPGADNISTMMQFQNTIFMQNTGTAITNKKDGTYSTIINLSLYDCGFELGGRALDIRQQQNLVINSCWFEGNASPPLLQKSGTFDQGCKFNSEDQHFSYISIASGIYAYGTGGVISNDASGGFSAKKYKHQMYNNDNLVDNGIIETHENIKSSQHYLEISNGTKTDALATVNAESTFLYNRSFHISIKQDGTITHDIPSSVTITASKLDTGTYQLLFSSAIDTPIITYSCRNKDSFNMTQALFCAFQCTYTVDAGTYNDFGITNKIIVYCYDAKSSNALADAKVMLKITPNNSGW